jgi:AraC-like DNA-binding protein
MVRIYFPNMVLAPFVECFNVMSHFFEAKAQVTVSARGIPMLMFPFKNPPITSIVQDVTGSTYPKPVVDGPSLLTCANVIGKCSFEKEVNFVMVMLKTTGAYHFLQSSVKDISNRVYLLSDLGLNPYFDELQDRLWYIQKPEAAVQLIQQFLTKYLIQKARIGGGDFAPVMNYMLRNPATIQVSDIARKFKCSERWIEKQCALQTSLSPKSWLRLIRFRAATNYWLSHPQSNWMEIVVRFGYNDQSHLIKDFHDFAGGSPTQRLANNGHAETMLKQNEAGLSGLIEKA